MVVTLKVLDGRSDVPEPTSLSTVRDWQPMGMISMKIQDKITEIRALIISETQLQLEGAFRLKSVIDIFQVSGVEGGCWFRDIEERDKLANS